MSIYPLQLRDLRFTLFEHLEATEHLGLDKDTLDAFIDAGATFVSEFLQPINQPGDLAGCTRHDDGSVTVAPGYKDAYAQWIEGEWGSVRAPESMGGQELPQALVTVLDELVIASCCAFHNFAGLTRACANMLSRRASDEQQQTWGRKLVSAEWQGTMCLTEAGAGSDVGASVTTAKPIEGDRYLIQGEKVFITSGDHDMVPQVVHMVLARVEGDKPGSKGLSIFIVPKLRLDADGNPTIPNDVFCSGIEEKMGIHGSVTTTMKFGENGGCEGYLIGERGQGISIMFEIMNEERIVVGQQGQALAASAYALALKYAKERIQGSSIAQGKRITHEKVAIIEHPDVRRMLMTCKAMSEAGRAMLLLTGLLIDRSEAAEGEEHVRLERRIGLLTPICKAWGSETGFQACTTAMQVFGGYGYCKEYRVEQLVRDARIACVYEGTNGIQAIDLLFRKVAGDRGEGLRELLGEIQAFVDQNQDAAGGRLADELAALGKHVGEIHEVFGALAKRFGGGDMLGSALAATPFLTLVGNVVGGYLLLQQALVAEAVLAEQGAPADAAARSEWAQGNEEQSFYQAKVETARFYVNQLLPENSWRAAQCTSEDRSALHAAL